jgi:DNA replication protein DnaC
MALTNSQYDEIMRGYDARQLHNKRILDERIRLAYLKEPRLESIDHAISSCSVDSARKLLDGDSAALSELHAQLAAYRKERAALLAALGYPSDYLEPIYTCPDCKDTGYIDGRKCHCLKQAIINTIYTQSNIKEILDRENFQSFSYEYYSDKVCNPATGLTALATIQNAVKECWNFINDFDHKPKNLFLYGETGVGKTFLSNCVAKELLDRSCSVIYFTAFQLFDILSKGVFDKDADAIAAHQNIFDCDLLIIDDLGTELSNSFTTSQLFLCVNERILRNKSTIISTNLSMGQIADLYSERTLSRILSSYTTIKLFGDDIRIRKRQSH